MNDIAELLDAWMDAEFAYRTSNFGQGRNLQEQHRDAINRREELAQALHELGART